MIRESGSRPRGTDSTVPRPSSQVICRQLGHAAVLIHLETNQIYELNATGSRIWELLQGGLNRNDIYDRMQQEFDVDATRAARDVNELLETLTTEQLITRDHGEHDAAIAS